MGFRYRKSRKIGPFRVTLSKSGVSYSFGSKFARVTKRADGRMQTTVTAPGTGLSYTATESRETVTKAAHPSAGVALAVLMVGLAFMVMIWTTSCAAGEAKSQPEAEAPAVEQPADTAPEKDSAPGEVMPETDTKAQKESEVKTETETETESESAEKPQDTAPDERAIYITKSGKRYHYDSSCNGGTYIKSTLAEAQRRGLTPCQKCVG